MLFRRAVQTGFWLLFVAAVAVSIRDWAGISPLPEFVRLDPLLWLGAFLSSGVFLPGAAQAGVVILSALVLGCFFCSHICPLGASMDALSALSKTRVRRPPQSWRRGKYIFLLVLVVAALWGGNLTHWGSPLSLATRLYTLVLWPLVHFLLLPLGLVPAGIFPSEPARVDHLAPLLLLLGAAVGSAWFVPRFWCRYLCPTGALLGIIGLHPLLSRKIGSGCTECGKCGQVCPSGITPWKEGSSECLVCRRCEGICPERALFWAVSDAPGQKFWPKRREFVGAALLGTAGAWLAWSGLYSYRGPRDKGQPYSGNLVRPPGALPEGLFLDLCVRCGACMRVCPTNMLQPQGRDEGGQGIFAPVARARRGPCRYECAACGEICPTGAIRDLPVSEKMWAKMGTAVVHRDRCLAWEWGRACLVCDEACPYGAIDMRRVEGKPEAVPFVREKRCTGCGACEYACPVRGYPAITISPAGALRLEKGSFREHGRRLKLSISRRHKDDEPDGSSSEKGGLPPGFSS